VGTNRASGSAGSRWGEKGPRVALFVKRTAYEEWVKERKDVRMRRLVRAHDETVSRLRAAHEEHRASLEVVLGALRRAGARVQRVDRSGEILHPGSTDLVVTVGGDGTLLRASHDVVGVPILAVNSAPHHSVGFFCGTRGAAAAEGIPAALAGRLRETKLARMRVRKNRDVVAPRVLNDCLFCHASPAATSRYLVSLEGVKEEHKSSGFWIGPAAGSTAAQRSAGGRVIPLTSKHLQLVVREPYTPHGESYRLRRVLVPDGAILRVKSKMHQALLFPDGGEGLGVEFGDELTFERSPEPLSLLGMAARRGWAPAGGDRGRAR